MTVGSYQNLIGGTWVTPSVGEFAPNIDPATGEEIGVFPRSGVADVALAIDAADAAQPAWAATSPAMKASVLMRASELLLEREQTIARDLTREEGKTLAEARGEVRNAAGKIRYAAGDASRMAGQTVPGASGLHLFTRREPLGVVALITPWNFPLSMAAGKFGAALATGNTVVLKPASLTPLSAVHLTRVFQDAGTPDGVINLVMGGGAELGDALLGDRRVRGVSFTGSTEVGVGIARAAATHLIKPQLELGGKNVVVVMEDADLPRAAAAITAGAFLSCGQKCTATSVVIAEAPILGELTEMLIERANSLKVGPGLDPDSDLGPLVDARQTESVQSYVELGKREGAELLTGGNIVAGLGTENFIRPAVFGGVDRAMRIAREEIFGPVLSIIAASDFDAALEMANDSDYGLSSAIFTSSLSYAHTFAAQMRAGVVKVNGATPGNAPNVPFGARKMSGLGISQMQIEFFTEMKSVYQTYAYQ